MVKVISVQLSESMDDTTIIVRASQPRHCSCGKIFSDAEVVGDTRGPCGLATTGVTGLPTENK